MKILMSSFVVFYVLIAGAMVQAHSPQPDGLTWMKIKASTKEERTKIQNVGVAIESVQPDYVTVLAHDKEKTILKKMGGVEVSFDYTPEMMDFPEKDAKFHNYQELIDAATDLKNKNKDIVQIQSIGKSREGRDLINIRLSANTLTELDQPAIVFMGTHHAREHLSTEVPLMLAEYLVDQYNKGNKDIQNLLQTRIVYIIPMVNPDGVEWDISSGTYKMWRKNRTKNEDGSYGIDLNRNYGYKWGGEGSSGDPMSEIYRGPAPFSEPETQSIKKFIESRTNITTLLTFHTYGKLIMYPWAHKYEAIQDEAALKVHKTMAETMAKWNGYTAQAESDLYLVSGDTCDWAYGEHKIISFIFEMDPDGSAYDGFYPGQSVIDEVFQKNLQPALYLIENSDNPYKVLDPHYKSLGFNTPIF